jgi:DNA polymerase
MPELTDGAVTKPTQVKRIKDWCAAEGYPMPDGLGAQLIEAALEGPNPPPPHVYEVLEMRKEFGSSSANKFKLATDLAYYGRVHMCLIKNGATTGRYASWNFQLHNLAKLKPLEDPNVLFQKFKDIEEIEQPFKAAKSLVRAIVKAPGGKKLCVADWAGIETCLLFWLVDDQDTLEILHNRGDLYKVMAAAVYNCSVEEVDRDTQRPLGKALILGCGYAMGHRRFKEAAKSFNLDISLPEANRAVNKYRQRFPKVVKAWSQLTNSAKRAILNPGTSVPCLKVSFYYENGSLWTTLPSGRKLHYPEACIKEGDVQYKGIRNSQWTTMRLTPMQNIENVIQAIAADILEEAVMRIDDEWAYDLLFHVHDEIVTEIDETCPGLLDSMIDLMCQLPEWAEGLPLFAEGYVAERFKK